jgi:hypothetical protein
VSGSGEPVVKETNDSEISFDGLLADTEYTLSVVAIAEKGDNVVRSETFAETTATTFP